MPRRVRRAEASVRKPLPSKAGAPAPRPRQAPGKPAASFRGTYAGSKTSGPPSLLSIGCIGSAAVTTVHQSAHAFF